MELCIEFFFAESQYRYIEILKRGRSLRKPICTLNVACIFSSVGRATRVVFVYGVLGAAVWLTLRLRAILSPLLCTDVYGRKVNLGIPRLLPRTRQKPLLWWYCLGSPVIAWAWVTRKYSYALGGAS